MKFKSWGNYPSIMNENIPLFSNHNEPIIFFEKHNDIIPFGNGRSYGDSALSKHIVNCKPRNYLIDFREDKGLLHCQSGLMLIEILELFVPRGWFLKVTPGTKLITVGGAIASDVHGKNHHVEGCFSECVLEFSLLLNTGNTIVCSRNENSEFFYATCGGMGLTGIILDVKFYLKKINSQYIKQTTIKTKNLQNTFESFETYKNKTYSVAWIDCLAEGKNMGRSLLMTGDFSNDGDLNYISKRKINIPFNFPGFTLNRFSVKFFNFLYYHKAKSGTTNQKIDIDTFFYPLDSILNWNRIYGKNGFTQYQFIFPKDSSFDGLEEILSAIANSGKGSFLAILKLYGPENKNYLSFPLEGYSLALDFKIEPDLFLLLDKLDQIVLKHKGRIYLAKDSRVSKEVFEKGYPKIEKFRQLRKDTGLNQVFNSLQSTRVQI